MGASIQRTAGFCWLATNFMIDHSPDGEVAEWLNAPHSKCGIRATVSGVRIPPSPPDMTYFRWLRCREDIYPLISPRCIRPANTPRHASDARRPDGRDMTPSA